MRKLGFYEIWIDIIFRHISSNWYSLIVNGTRQACFKSERGLRQGDPISPSLFVICADFLSKKLNHITTLEEFKSFHMNINGPLINHLAFDDDVILFSSGCRNSLMMLIEALSVYEKVSGQLVNKSKSCFILAPNAHVEEISRVKNITEMENKSLPIKYLGFLSVIHPPNGVLNQIERMLTRFFGGGSAEKKRHHWDSWDNLCFPYEEGVPISGNLMTSAKQWWNFRTGQSLWKRFLMVALWYDNWSELGPLYKFLPEGYKPKNITLSSMMLNNHINWRGLDLLLPQHVVVKVNTFQISLRSTIPDSPVWTEDNSGSFSVASAC
ncbi:uncharacterized protein [Nicotiana tomentosiformis]|uniref:uncharacterized protein n=1 Tax=Nicotiana tomentosiformis TaxID=4098 RepID=UPI00388CB43A